MKTNMNSGLTANAIQGLVVDMEKKSDRQASSIQPDHRPVIAVDTSDAVTEIDDSRQELDRSVKVATPSNSPSDLNTQKAQSTVDGNDPISNKKTEIRASKVEQNETYVDQSLSWALLTTHRWWDEDKVINSAPVSEDQDARFKKVMEMYGPPFSYIYRSTADILVARTRRNPSIRLWILLNQKLMTGVVLCLLFGKRLVRITCLGKD